MSYTLKSLHDAIASPAFLDHVRFPAAHKPAFQRDRVLTPRRMLGIFLSNLVDSVDSELRHTFATMTNVARFQGEVPSAQAFSQARRGFNDGALDWLNRTLLTDAAPAIKTLASWCGCRVVAADGSVINVPIGDAQGRGWSTQQGRIMALLVPGAELVLAARIGSALQEERQMLLEMLDELDENDVLVLDRGFPSRVLLAYLSQNKRHFCARIDGCHWPQVEAFRRSGEAEAYVRLHAPLACDAAAYGCQATATPVRLVRVTNPGGPDYVLVTSLLDAQRYPVEAFRTLYWRRWRVEVHYLCLKHRLSLEQFSGRSWLAAQQDLKAKMLFLNLTTLALYAATGKPPYEEPELPMPAEKHSTTDQDDQTAEPASKRKAMRISNLTYALREMKRYLAPLLLVAGTIQRELSGLLAVIAQHQVTSRRGQQAPRSSTKNKPHKFTNMKSA